MPYSDFKLDSHLADSCIALGSWSLSMVLLKNNNTYPWMILVPRRAEIREFHELAQSDRYVLMDEIARLSALMGEYFKPTKINVGALGNVVPQLHIHVIARYQHDIAWPFGIWQETMPEGQPYATSSKEVETLHKLINAKLSP